MPTLNDINQLLIEGLTSQALSSLRQWAEQNGPEHLVEIDMQLARFNDNQGDYLRGTVTLEEHRVLEQRVREAVLFLLQQLKGPAAAAAAKSEALHDYHRYTCDRVEQTDVFERLFEQTKVKRTHFYYLYGGDLQSHEGLFRRLAFQLEGRLLDYLNPDLATTCKSLQVELTFDFSRQLDIYKENIVKSLFAAMSIPVNDHEPLLQKNLLYVLEKSPKLNGLTQRDYVCIFFHISQYDWDSQLTPEAAKWFIHQFCEPVLPEASPHFLFYFAVEYDEADSQIRSELEAVVAQSDQVSALPELSMVHLRDIARWFEKYKKIEPDTRKRKALIEFRFKEQEHYMEDVELVLQEIIDTYNKQFIR